MPGRIDLCAPWNPNVSQYGCHLHVILRQIRVYAGDIYASMAFTIPACMSVVGLRALLRGLCLNTCRLVSYQWRAAGI